MSCTNKLQPQGVSSSSNVIIFFKKPNMKKVLCPTLKGFSAQVKACNECQVVDLLCKTLTWTLDTENCSENQNHAANCSKGRIKLCMNSRILFFV